MKIDYFTKIFGIIAAIGAGILALYQYNSGNEYRRAENLMDFSREMSSDPLKEARFSVQKFFQKETNETVRSLYPGYPGIPSSNIMSPYKHYARDVIIRMIESEHFKNKIDQNIRQELVQIITFLDRVYDCMRLRVCDSDLARQNFGPLAAEIYFFANEYIEELRISAQDEFGRGAQNLGGGFSFHARYRVRAVHSAGVYGIEGSELADTILQEEEASGFFRDFDYYRAIQDEIHSDIERD